jgi:FtsP/CotA-like multicopper oxidase with cupredoxin domain
MLAALALTISCALHPVVTRTETPLNCLDLVPTPDLAQASGTVSLLPASTLFGAAVTRDGRTRYRLTATIDGLPDPRSLGSYTTYVAWAYTISLDSAVKLGEVHNGRIDLGGLAWMQFRILISAERSARVSARHGRLVLRGTSPSMRLLAHRDLRVPLAPGAAPDLEPMTMLAGAMNRDSMPGMAHSGTPPSRSDVVWRMPPVSPRMSTMPGMQGLSPAVAPYLPELTSRYENHGMPSRAPTASVIRARANDTITLVAGGLASDRRASGILLGYNGRSPGPRIDVEQGSTVTVRSLNALDLPTSIHWHGVRLANRFDGAAGITQPETPRDSTFEYTVRFPDAGIFWYHPHAHDDVEQGLGLYGNIIVHPADPGYYGPADREAVLMLSDALADDEGPIPFGATAPTHVLMGRFGNVFLVNGVRRYVVEAAAGDVVRLYLSNASNARTYNISIPGARMKLVGGDASKFEHEAWVESVVVAPAERYIVDVQLPRAGRIPLLNRVQAIDHMVGSYWPEVDTLAFVYVRPRNQRNQGAGTGTFASLRRNADVEANIDRLRAAFVKPVDHELVLTMRAHDLPMSLAAMLSGINAPVDWNDGMPMMNWLTTPREVTWVLRDPATGRENMDIDWRFRRGEIVKLRIFNDPASPHAMAHPIHLHGQRFLVLTRDGVESQNLVWKDTALIPAGQTVELLVEMANPGRWMLHCHIAEHLSSGMMATFTVQ